MMKASRPIYLDNNATTPLDPQVLAAMMPYLTEAYGNASSAHSYGYEARKAVQKAREQVAALVGCEPGEIYWTSGATESNNLGLWGVVKNFKAEHCHVVTSAIEHKAVVEVVQQIAKASYGASIIGADCHGQVTVQALEPAVQPSTRLISVMAANNEVGTLNPIDEIGAWCKARDIVFHCDAAQALGKIPLRLRHVDMASFSAHKIYGPKGVGALYARRGLRLQSILAGGRQEAGIRPGTLNVPAIVGFGVACELAAQGLESEPRRLCELRDQTWQRLKGITPEAELNGHPTERLPGHLNLTVPHLDPDEAALALSEFALSRGSACSQNEASYVLLALGRSEALARRSWRIGFGRFNTAEDASRLWAAWSRLFEPAQRCYTADI